MKKLITGFVVLLFSTVVLSHGDEQKAEAKADKSVFIISPKDGATVGTEFKVVFGIKGMTVSPAGVKKHNSGHHHLLIDGKKLPDMSKPLGAEVTHFGAGQTETTVKLTPGKHTLQLILGDHMHQPHSPPVVSKTITVTVE
jgi:hypothetical protein